MDNFKFITNGNGQNLESQLVWNPQTENATDIQWRTRDCFHLKSLILCLNLPSLPSTNSTEISKEALVSIDSTSIDVTNFKLSSGEQFILANGKVSKNDADKLKFELNGGFE
ncbi:MAG: hypothetical protein R2779_07640 [Crocinitomicaceae bacterium]